MGAVTTEEELKVEIQAFQVIKDMVKSDVMVKKSKYVKGMVERIESEIRKKGEEFSLG